MACKCTQLQDTIDEVTTQFYSSIHYLSSHHNFEPLWPGQTVFSDPNVQPLPAEELAFSQRDLAHDIVLKFQQIEKLITELPGVSVSPEQQYQQVKELQEKIDEKQTEEEQLRKENAVLQQQLTRRIEALDRLVYEVRKRETLPAP
ncbi:mediator complex subunit Srb7 [Schizosaccharomyces japonicus yFS275]|uniref:Mediator of RNA polymerase II transcription subunit 21 n=1 Tax=Schizosaccharomyces japonicus (strain yFS275 / FY16936) TaxID=402676 RepID=B6JWR4_SCHJY|nr:mediator complex subunit Srb7 [Schizosaccharomyces japonicus yFS275]EEB05815.1 mediator complex subunit Srb7 [Schizosaccharomyces japonicus yFS275]